MPTAAFWRTSPDKLRWLCTLSGSPQTCSTRASGWSPRAEEERRRLRRDLHDGLGAQLAGLNVQAGALRRLIPRDPDAAEEVVVELREELRSAIADIRRLVYDLRPPALDDLGLVESLRQLAERYGSKDEPLSVLVEATEDLPNLPAAVEVAVYRITQEALTNVARHARARNCVVRLVVE